MIKHPHKKSHVASVLKSILTLIISGICLYYAARNIEWTRIWQDIRTMQPAYAAVAGLITVVAISMRALRWHLVVRGERPLSLSNTFWATWIGYLGNNILPARAGEFIRIII
jgi:uncharacterized membrane protein YbhN (UPF0104 family)